MIDYSLIIPAHNASETLRKILPPLASLKEKWEVIIIDDSSLRSPQELISELLPSAAYVRSARAKGAAGARNHGASLARGQYLCFLDSDVVVQASTLEAMMNTLESSRFDGIFGCYSACTPVGQSYLSRFRNLLHRVVHHRCAGQVDSFWTGLSVVRKEAFEAVEGFDEGLSDKASIEDVEFGARITAAGYKVLLDPQFQGVHLKNWTWESMIHTDIWLRAAPWTELIWQGRVDAKSMNGGSEFRIPPLLLLATFCSIHVHWLLVVWVACAYLISISGLCLRIAREGGVRVGIVAIPGLIVHHSCCCIGAVVGCLRFLKSKIWRKRELSQ